MKSPLIKCLLIILALSCGPRDQVSEAQQPPTKILRGHIPPGARSLPAVGRLGQSYQLHLAIGLPLRDPAGLRQFLNQLYDASNAHYHEYLTSEQFTARFGPTEADYAAVVRFARDSGFEIVATHPNRLLLDVIATVADIERALRVRLRTYQHPTEGRIFYAPDTEPVVDATLPILQVEGLNNYALPRPRHIHELGPVYRAGPKTGSGQFSTYAGYDFRAAYIPGVTLTGSGQKIALLEFDGFYPGDISAYRTQAGLPNVPTSVVAVNGGVPSPGNGNVEVALDIEVAMAMAPGASGIYVYEAPNGSTPWTTILNKIANDNLAKQVSCSWGGGDPNATAEQIFQQMAAQGQSFFNASGDNDAFTGSIPFPSDSPNIIQVGGTTVATAGAGGAWQSEAVWNWGLHDGDYVGSSGGISTYYSIPTWQQGINMADNKGSIAQRNVPDVALTADNVYVTYGNGQYGSVGGTSCAAPLWAAFTALINQQGAANGQSSVGFLNPALYSLGKSTDYTAFFHDITTGDNTWPSSPNQFYAVAGYDLCTGWGTPTGGLISALAPPAAGNGSVQDLLLPNGGFEYTWNSEWISSGSGGVGTDVYSHSGAYDGYFSNEYHNVGAITRTALTIPSNATSATLTFWLNIVTQEPDSSTPHHVLAVNVIDASGVTHQVASYSEFNKGSNTDGNYFQTSVDLTAYIGQRVQLQFAVTNTSNSATVFRIDDLSLLVSPGTPTITYDVSVTASTNDGGTVTGGRSYAANTTANLSASPASGYDFVGWTENGNLIAPVTGSYPITATYSFPVTASRAIVANFNRASNASYTITTSSAPTAGGTTTGAGKFPNDTYQTVTATSKAGYTFANWTDNGTVVSSSSSYTFLVTSNRNLTANFSPTNGSAQVLTPPPGSTLNSSSVTFSWSAGTNVSEYQLFIGSSVGGSDYYGASTGLNRSVTVSNLPTDGSILYVRLWSHIGSSWLLNDYVYSDGQKTSCSITLSATPSAGGTTSGAGTFAINSSRTVTATARSGYIFGHWLENNSSVSDSANYTFTLTGDRNLVAQFYPSSASYTISTTSAPAQGGTTSGGGSFSPNSTQTVTATPNSGYTFVNWTENGSVVSTSPSYTFNVTGNRQLVANFSAVSGNYTITTSSSPAAGGTTAGGGSFAANSSQTVTATPNSGYKFVNWTENGSSVSTSSTYTFTLMSNRNLVANFAANTTTNYTITTSSSPTNGGTTSGAGTFAANTSHTVTATPNSGYKFVSWTQNGAVVSNSASYTFTLTSNRNLVANFATSSSNYTITTSSAPSNGGSTAGGGTFAANTSHTVTATAGSGYVFSNWSENGATVSTSASYTFTLTSNRNLVANFTATAANYTITTSSSPSNGGTTSGGGTFAANTSHTVTATAGAGFAFSNWTENGSIVSSSSSYTFTLGANRNLVANFTANNGATYTITATPVPTNGGTVSGAGTFAGNSSRTVTATAKTGYRFANWSEDGTIVSTSASYSFTLTNNRTLVANFNSTTGAAQMVSPVPGSTFASSSVTFSWSAGAGVSEYQLFVGSTPGATNYYGSSTALNRSATVTNLPGDGSTVYVRLWSHVGSSWYWNDYAYYATQP